MCTPCTLEYVRVYGRVHLHTFLYVREDMCTPMYTYVHVYTCTFVYTYVRFSTRVYVRVHVCTRVYYICPVYWDT